MENYIIMGIIALIVLIAIARAVKHFKGGGCCGSAGNTIRDKKTLNGPKVGEKRMSIEGMTCINCEIRIENALNRIENVAAKVSWKKGTAIVSYSAEIPGELLKQTVEKMGYKVTKIQ